MKRLALIAVLVLAGCSGQTVAPASIPAPATPTSRPTSAATPVPTTGPAAIPTPTPDLTEAAVHIAAAIDDLATGADPVGWFLTESQWLTGESGLSLSNPAIAAFAGTLAAGLQTSLDEGDFAADIAAMIALRPQIAALAPGAIGTPEPTPTPAAPVVVKGKGSQNTKPFNLPGGDFTVVMTGTGDGNVIARLELRGGDVFSGEGLFNEIAYKKYRYETTIYAVDAGSYYLDVTVDNAWVVTFTPLA